nr:hypothetical protein CFP56_11485 [Quercus suber]
MRSRDMGDEGELDGGPASASTADSSMASDPGESLSYDGGVCEVVVDCIEVAPVTLGKPAWSQSTAGSLCKSSAKGRKSKDGSMLCVYTQCGLLRPEGCATHSRVGLKIECSTTPRSHVCQPGHYAYILY